MWKYRNNERSVMFTSVLKDSESGMLRVTRFVNSVHCGILNRICLGNWICCLFSGENGRETPTWFDPSERTNVNHWTPHISKTGSILNTRPRTQRRHSVIWGVMHWKSINPLHTEWNPICHLLALLGAHHIYISRIRVKIPGPTS